MLSLAFTSTCPLCTLTSLPRRAIQDALRTPPTMRLMSRIVHRPQPSRMVLSDRVDRPPYAKDGRKPSRRTVDGPFAGMNQTVAKIPPKKTSETATRPMQRSRRPARLAKPDGEKRATRDGGDTRKALKMQQALKAISYGTRTRIKDRMLEFDSFDKFNLLPSVHEAVHSQALAGMVDIKPTPVQRLAIPALLGQGKGNTRASEPRPGRQDFLLAAETGSGKTLAYLIPSINAMKIAEATDEEILDYQRRMKEELERQKTLKKKGPSLDEPHPTMARPRIVILVPTAELVNQVGGVAKLLSHTVKFRSEMLSANMNPKVIHRNLFSPRGVDLIVTTPHLLASIAESDPNVLSRVSHLIVDEADSLFDRSFTPVTMQIVERAMPSLQQFILCSATIPKKLDSFLEARHPNMLRITTPNLHAIPRRVQLGVIDVTKHPYMNNKDLACADAIYSIGREAVRHGGPIDGQVQVRRIMVFVNEREKAQEVAEYLVSKGIDAMALHRDADEQRKSEMLTSFTSPERETIQTPTTPAARRTLPNTKVLVATDLLSRGVDTLAVRHVVLYDVPHTTIDFIHRLGRAGRMGRRGRGIVLVGKDDRRDIVAEVKHSMFMGQALI